MATESTPVLGTPELALAPHARLGRQVSVVAALLFMFGFHGAARRQGMPETVGGLSLTQLLDERQLAFGEMDADACAALGAYVGNNLQLHKIIFPSGIEMEATVAKLDLSNKRLGVTDATLLAAFLPRWYAFCACCRGRCVRLQMLQTAPPSDAHTPRNSPVFFSLLGFSVPP